MWACPPTVTVAAAGPARRAQWHGVPPTDGATAREWAQRADVCIAAAAAALRGAGRALAAGQTHAPVSLDAVVGAMVDAASREQLWYVGQGRRAAGLTPDRGPAGSPKRWLWDG